jgi:hypothetical protein
VEMTRKSLTGAREAFRALHSGLAVQNTVSKMYGYISIYQITKEKTRKDLWRPQGRKGGILFVKQEGGSFSGTPVSSGTPTHHPAGCGQ